MNDGPVRAGAALSTTRVARASAEPASRVLAGETPLAVECDGEPYAVMMVTPADWEDFAVGFAFAERIIERSADIARIDVRHGAKGSAVDIRLEKARSERLASRRRALPGQTGCGLCGIMTLDEALPPFEPLSGCPPLGRTAIFDALRALPESQTLNRETGAVHAAAFCDTRGRLALVREDVGRHNALDKVIGALLRSGADRGAGFALVTSRCSYELVQKAVLARIPLLAAISAPTQLAVDIARAARLTLVALARDDNFQVFNDPYERFASALATSAP